MFRIRKSFQFSAPPPYNHRRHGNDDVIAEHAIKALNPTVFKHCYQKISEILKTWEKDRQC